jgi:hypothetical protein
MIYGQSLRATEATASPGDRKSSFDVFGKDA